MLKKILREVSVTLLLAILAALVLTVLGAGGFVYAEYFEVTPVCSEVSPDQHYTVFLDEIGSPKWPFGPVKARLTVKGPGGKVIDRCSFWLNNDGTGVYYTNLRDALWYPDRVEIVMRGADDRENTVYTLWLIR